MVSITPTPTVDLFLAIPVPMERGGWAWGEHLRFAGILAAEYAYSGREACALVRAYAVTLARLVRPSEADRFNILARGRVTGMVCARDEWSWSAELHAFLPSGDPWDTSKPGVRRYWELTGVMITSQKFRARVEGYPPDHDRDTPAPDEVPLLRPIRGGTKAHARGGNTRRTGSQAA